MIRMIKKLFLIQRITNHPLPDPRQSKIIRKNSMRIRRLSKRVKRDHKQEYL